MAFAAFLAVPWTFASLGFAGSWERKNKHLKRQFSAKLGGIFEDSALGLDKWFVANWTVANCKTCISSYEVARSLASLRKRRGSRTTRSGSPCAKVIHEVEFRDFQFSGPSQPILVPGEIQIQADPFRFFSETPGDAPDTFVTRRAEQKPGDG